jgi:fatty-acyl-CoA synthase
MSSTMMNFPLTLIPILERAGQVFPEVEIVTRQPDKSLHRHTYADFHRRAKALAEVLVKLGLKPGERVGTLMWNNYAHLEAYFGIPAAGGVLHTLNLRLFPEDIAWIANHAEDRFLIVDDVLLPLYEKFKDQVKFEKVIVFPFSGKPVPAGYEDYEALLKTATGKFEYPKLAETDGAGMCYTSGTTGKPKGVLYSHRSSVLHAFAIALPDGAGLSMRDSVVPVVPMFHANAWGLPYAATMMGSKQVMPGPHLDAESLLDLFDKEKVTLAAGVPTIWMGVLQALEKEPKRWNTKGMRMTVGGSAVPESMMRAFDKHGLRVEEGWGMTELSPLGSLARIKPSLDSRSVDEQYGFRAKAGVPLPFVEVRIMGDEGIAPWDGKTVGELQVRGPWVTGSYYKLPESDAFTDDGWFRTGDVAAMLPEGYISITDRTKDLIKSGGEWISSVDLENEIMAHPAVKEAAVIAANHPKWMERPLAVVVLKEGQKLSKEELRTHLKAKFADWWLPDGVAYLDEIPRTSTGKFLKTKLRDQYADWKWD